jgi:hydrogenase-4 component E
VTEWAEIVLILAAMANLVLLGSSRQRLCIRAVAVQGVSLGLFTLLAHASDLSVHVFILATMGVVLKGLVFPTLLFRTLEHTELRREAAPAVGYTASILAGIGMLAAALWLSTRLPALGLNVSPLVLPTALWTIFVGLFTVVARPQAISQVLGYLVLENGIFLFGAALVGEMPFLVEIGGLLDVFVAVFVMGIAIFHINREFEHLDTDRMSALKD